MSDFTIEQLEALKENTTPGKWEINPLSGNVASFGHGEIAGTLSCPSDRELIMAAPALVDALIAEKQAHQETLHLVRELWSDVHHHGNVGRASILRHLTRILETTDE